MLRVAEQFAKSDTGRQRQGNEDSLFARAPVFVVADGMGGAQAGEVASRLAVEVFEPGLPDGGNPEERLAERAREANLKIHDHAQSDSSRAGMGTTLSAAYVGEDEVSIAHVGDSRIYLWRDGELTRLTRDHTLVEELVRRGKLTEEQAEDHPQRSIITRALGPEPDVDIDTRTQPARPGDVFLLCSDGLTSMVPEARVAEILAESSSLDAAGRALVDAANAAGGRDNITVLLFRLEDVEVASRAEIEQPTTEGERAPVLEAVRPEPKAVEPRVARTAGPARPRRRRSRRIGYTVAALALLVPIVLGAWVATRAVYFIGTDHGQVAIFQGLPYDLPAGIHLYSTDYVSGVPAADLAPARRDKLLDHKLRSRNDASDLVHRLELGQVR